MSGLVQSYCPLRVFSFLNLSPSAASTLCGANGGGARVKLLCRNGSLNTGHSWRPRHRQTDRKDIGEFWAKTTPTL